MDFTEKSISSIGYDRIDNYIQQESIGVVLDNDRFAPYKYLFNLDKAKFFKNIDLDTTSEREFDPLEENHLLRGIS